MLRSCGPLLFLLLFSLVAGTDYWIECYWNTESKIWNSFRDVVINFHLVPSVITENMPSETKCGMSLWRWTWFKGAKRKNDAIYCHQRQALAYQTNEGDYINYNFDFSLFPNFIRNYSLFLISPWNYGVSLCIWHCIFSHVLSLNATKRFAKSKQWRVHVHKSD